jgi:hypothetical protein
MERPRLGRRCPYLTGWAEVAGVGVMKRAFLSLLLVPGAYVWGVPVYAQEAVGADQVLAGSVCPINVPVGQTCVCKELDDSAVALVRAPLDGNSGASCLLVTDDLPDYGDERQASAS